MSDKYRMTPPPELVDSIWNQFKTGPTRNLLTSEAFREAITKAAQWGADQELETCCEWFVRDWTDIETADKLRAARRPKPPRLKEQALALINRRIGDGYVQMLTGADAETIRRALEALPND